MTDQRTNGSDLNETAESMKARAKETMDESVASIQGDLDTLSAQASEGLETALEQGSRFLRNNPGTALIGAVSLGVLIGMALKQR